MRSLPQLFILVVFLGGASTLTAQQLCRGFTVVMNSPEDKLMQAVNGSATAQAEVQALDAYAQTNPTSSFMSCVEEYYAAAYLKENDYPHAIEYGQKALAAHDQNELLLVNITKAYVGSAEAVPEAFAVIMMAPAEIQAETPRARPSGASDADWQKTQSDDQAEAKDITAYMEYAFFALLSRVQDTNQRIQYLDQLTKTYSDSGLQGRADFQYFVAYKMLNQTAKADAYGEKAVAEDPNNVDALNLLAYDYGIGRTNLHKAAEYAAKVLQLAPQIKKPVAMPEEQFQSELNSKLGLAHLTLGYVNFVESTRTKRIAPAIDQFKTAISLLDNNPFYQAQALYFLGNAYEFQYPPDHRAAAAALERAASLKTPVAAQARELLAKVRAAERR